MYVFTLSSYSKHADKAQTGPGNIYTRRILQRRATNYKHDYYVYLKLRAARISKYGVVFDCTRQNLSTTLHRLHLWKQTIRELFSIHTWLEYVICELLHAGHVICGNQNGKLLNCVTKFQGKTDELTSVLILFYGFWLCRGPHGTYKFGLDTSTEQSVGFAFHDTTLWD
jgi:hypothetical protein